MVSPAVVWDTPVLSSSQLHQSPHCQGVHTRRAPGPLTLLTTFNIQRHPTLSDGHFILEVAKAICHGDFMTFLGCAA